MDWLNKFGWYEYSEFPAEDVGRIITDYGKRFKVVTKDGIKTGVIAGNLLNRALDNSDLPCIGDWVKINNVSDDECVITYVLKRKNKISRKCRGRKVEEQIIAANIDYAFIIIPMDNITSKINVDKFLLICRNENIKPILLLSKIDVLEDLRVIEDFKAYYKDIEIFPISTTELIGVEELKVYFNHNKTSVFIGPSGAGKSTLINYLAGKNIMKTNSVSEKDLRGRHTTTFKNLILLDSGGLIIDTPGLINVIPWCEDNVLEDVYDDIEDLVKMCKFRNCTHTNEPECMVREAIKSGVISQDRFNNYIKIKKEVEYINSVHRFKGNSSTWEDIENIRKVQKKKVYRKRR
ncbi:ribosome small subunit-dependent GTPase A [Caloranaerobacter sp. DY30410]|uniref:ribosome small subunit-dependent GTPase A n=1 Tax=Caloranaerobacter sp. DY30410 TaxID=3238305 RepID=UPI003D004482